MVRLVELKERIMLYQYIDHFIALLFETVYFQLCYGIKDSEPDGCSRRHWGSQVYIHLEHENQGWIMIY